MKKRNFTVRTDGYKLGHWRQYQANCRGIESYFENRLGAEYPETSFFGLQAWMKENICGQVITREDIEEGEELTNGYLGTGQFNRLGWEYILNKHGGRLPLEIYAVDEGSEIPVNNILFKVVSTETPWLVGHTETPMTHIWSPSLVATKSKAIKRILRHFLIETTGNDAGLPFMLHDFGYRGASSDETAESAGGAHLTNFRGTDTVAAISWIRSNYGAPHGYALSIPATEHSVMTSLGREGESKIVGQFIDSNPKGPISCVADSYDIFNFARNIVGRDHKEKILKRDKFSPFVTRPDSGDPVFVIIRLLELLEESFGTILVGRGYKELNPVVRVIWGDGLKPHEIHNILENLRAKGWAASNMVFGMGGGLLQNGTRDVQRSAFKCSSQLQDGVWVDIYKDPLSGLLVGEKDSKGKSKASKRGRLDLDLIDGQYKTVRQEDCRNSQLKLVFKNGELVNEQSWEDIVKRASIL